jgi:glutamate-ammonia-ligase adenylyltransferase
VSARLKRRLLDALGDGPLADRLAAGAAPLLELRGDDEAAARLDGPVLAGLARVLASRPRMGAFLSHRPALLERIADADAGTLRRRAQALHAEVELPEDDLEGGLDALRLLRREETCLAACLDLGAAVGFGEVSEFLSILAETITRRTLELAHPTGSDRQRLSVIGMGKIAGREFTYHSDLDLIFLYEGGPDHVMEASRIGQRLISYLTTMTGAGVAYAVDARLRPSGQQGMLVTSFSAFEQYQRETAETWEHLAMLRARAIAGETERAQETLDRVRQIILARRENPWRYLGALRERVVAERASASARVISFKTGRGGLMDVDFLAGGGLLECGDGCAPKLPSAAEMLRAVVRGSAVDALLESYRFLRLLEARGRWLAGRALEEIETAPGSLELLAELVEPGLAPDALLARVASERRRIRGAYERVLASDSIRALGGDSGEP